MKTIRINQALVILLNLMFPYPPEKPQTSYVVGSMQSLMAYFATNEKCDEGRNFVENKSVKAHFSYVNGSFSFYLFLL